MTPKSFYKIIHTSSRTVWGNTEERIFQESLWMTKKGHQIIVIAPFGSPLFKKSKEKGIQVYPLSFNFLARLGEYSQLKRILAAEKPFAVNCHGTNDAWLALKAARTSGIPCRIFSRHAGTRIQKTWPGRRKYNQYCHYTFTDSPQAIPLLQKHFKIKDIRIFSIPTGIVEPPSLADKDHAKRELSFKFGLPPDTRFLGVSDQRPLSQDHIILKAFDTVKTRLPHHMVVVTDISQPLAEDLKTSLVKATQGRIHFMDIKDDAWLLYRALDGMVFFPKTYEAPLATGIPNCLFEMMYAQCPVIAPHHSGVTDILDQAQCGLLFDQDCRAETLGQMLVETIDQTGIGKVRLLPESTSDSTTPSTPWAGISFASTASIRSGWKSSL